MTKTSAERQKEIRRKNPEKVRARENKYWSEHKEKKAEKDRRYYLKNRDEIKARTRKYAIENEDRQKYCKQASFCRKKLEDSNMTANVVQIVYEDNIKRYGTLTCYLCRKPIIFGDDCLEHKYPISRGGTHDYDNLAIAHMSCNSSKNDKYLEDFLKFS